MSWGSTVLPENSNKMQRRVICGHRIKTIGEIKLLNILDRKGLTAMT
jgi:hypothetical protein